MKREPTTREALAVHEAGHFVAMCWLSKPGELLWRRLPAYEIAHVRPLETAIKDWETPSRRNALIAAHAVIALAGGAAEFACAGRTGAEALSLEAIHGLVGRVDFELAHEWLTLQRYDGHQRALELEARRLFLELCESFRRPAQVTAIETVASRILAQLQIADGGGADTMTIPAAVLGEGVELSPSPHFSLQSTVARPAPAAPEIACAASAPGDPR